MLLTKLFIKLQKLDRNKYRKRALISGTILITILALDLHRFGAWYMESRTYVKPYWIPGILIVSYPMFKYSLSGLIQYLASRQMFRALYFLMFFIAALPFSFCNPQTLRIFAWGGRPWYEKDIFSSGAEFYIGLAWIIPTVLIFMVISLAVGYYNDHIWPWLEKKISGEKDS